MTGNQRIDARVLASPWAMAIFLFVIGLLPRLIGLGDHPPRTDELYHIIAGRSWAEDGTLAMGAGSYHRAHLYSIATGVMFKLFGVGLEQGRLLGALSGALEVVALGLWLRAVAGARAGWVGGLLLALNHFAVEQAQSARFYCAHALMAWIFATSVFAMLTGGVGQGKIRLAALGAVAAFSLALAIHLQPLTAIIVIAVGCWVGLWLLINGKLDFFFGSWRRTVITSLIVLVAGAVFAIVARNLLLDAWQMYRRAPGWAEAELNDTSFYLQELSYSLNWMFSLAPVAAMIAWRRNRDAVLFCLVIIVVAALGQSFGGMKAKRYIFYLYPFFIALWGMAFAVAAPIVVQWWEKVAPPMCRWRNALEIGLFAAVAGFALICANSYRSSLVALSHFIRTGSPDIVTRKGWGQMEVDWTPYLGELRRFADSGSVFIATDMTRTIYYLGDYDILLNRSDLDDAGDGEFVYDDRSGRFEMGSGAALERIIRCYPSGTLLMADFGNFNGIITPDVWDVIHMRMHQVPLPPELLLQGYAWNGKADSNSPECRAIYDAGYVHDRHGGSMTASVKKPG
jgi:hypothetical protein